MTLIENRIISLGSSEELDDAMLTIKKEPDYGSRGENDPLRDRNPWTHLNTSDPYTSLREVYQRMYVQEPISENAPVYVDNGMVRQCSVDPEVERQANAAEEKRRQVLREYVRDSSFREWANAYIPLEPQEPQANLCSRSNELIMEYTTARNYTTWNYEGT